jgi:hypothetical protein
VRKTGGWEEVWEGGGQGGGEGGRELVSVRGGGEKEERREEQGLFKAKAVKGGR